MYDTLAFEGLSCDDPGDPCVDGPFVCTSGACTGTPVSCSNLDSDCAVGLCDENGACQADPLPDDSFCSDDDDGTVSDGCAGGSCVGTLIGDASMIIPDDDPDGLIFFVPTTCDGTIDGDVTVTFTVNHSRAPDLSATLRSPDLTTVSLYAADPQGQNPFTIVRVYSGFDGEPGTGYWRVHFLDSNFTFAGRLQDNFVIDFVCDPYPTDEEEPHASTEWN